MYTQYPHLQPIAGATSEGAGGCLGACLRRELRMFTDTHFFHGTLATHSPTGRCPRNHEIIDSSASTPSGPKLFNALAELSNTLNQKHQNPTRGPKCFKPPAQGHDPKTIGRSTIKLWFSCVPHGSRAPRVSSRTRTKGGSCRFRHQGT